MAIVYSRPGTSPAPGRTPSNPPQAAAPAPSTPNPNAVLMDGVTPAVKMDRRTGHVTGFLSGIFTGLFLMGFGSLLTLTGIGAVIGVPMALFGFLTLFISPFARIQQMRGECPYCGTQVTTHPNARGFNCPACKERILIGTVTFRRKDRKVY